jgi:hypothetical protein
MLLSEHNLDQAYQASKPKLLKSANGVEFYARDLTAGQAATYASIGMSELDVTKEGGTVGTANYERIVGYKRAYLVANVVCNASGQQLYGAERLLQMDAANFADLYEAVSKHHDIRADESEAEAKK